MKTRNIIAVSLILLSFALLIPGIVRPLITISASFSFMGRTTELFNETRSILQTIRSLHESGNDFVAGLILVFGIVVPILKGVMLILALLFRHHPARPRMVGFVRGISKWAMNDVFVVAVFTAFLAARATSNLDATIRDGFYWFTAYCMVSLASLQFIQLDVEPETVRDDDGAAAEAAN